MKNTDLDKLLELVCDLRAFEEDARASSRLGGERRPAPALSHAPMRERRLPVALCAAAALLLSMLLVLDLMDGPSAPEAELTVSVVAQRGAPEFFVDLDLRSESNIAVLAVDELGRRRILLLDEDSNVIWERKSGRIRVGAWTTTPDDRIVRRYVVVLIASGKLTTRSIIDAIPRQIVSDGNWRRVPTQLDHLAVGLKRTRGWILLWSAIDIP